MGPISGGVTALTGHGKLSRRVCVARPSRGERCAPLPAELGAADGPTGRFRADLGPFCVVLGQNRATQLKISPPRMVLFIFLTTILARAREATGTPSDCTAPSTSHNRGPSTAYRCRRKIAFRRCPVVINRPIWPLCHKFCFGTHRSTVESRSGAQPSKVSSIGPG